MTALAVLGAVVGTVVAGPQYSSTAVLRVPSGNAAGETVGLDDLQYTDRLINTYQRIGQSTTVRRAVERRVPEARELVIEVEPDPNTELVDLTARTVDDAAAIRAANVAAQVLLEEAQADSRVAQNAVRSAVVRQLEALETRLGELRSELTRATDAGRRAELEQAVRTHELRSETLAQQAATLDLAAEARQHTLLLEEPATSASGGLPGSIVRHGVVALILGLAAGTGLALLLERRSPQLATVEEVENAIGSKILATIPSAGNAAPTVFNARSPQHIAFSNLRTRLLLEGTITVLVISAQDGDGKSTVAVNLAAAFAHAGRRSLVIDANFREPAVHQFLGMDPDDGLADVLDSSEPADVRLARALRPTAIPQLDVLTSGRDVSNAAALLATPRMSEILLAAEQRYDNIVVDCSSLGTGEDTDVASHVEEFVWVVGGLPVPRQVVTAAQRRIEGFHPRKVQVVVNRVADGSDGDRSSR